MTRSLYARLFRYVARDGRTPLENFLTEALADIANRLPPADNVEFVRSVLMPGVDPERQTAVLGALSSARRCQWTTQQAIAYGETTKYPDLLLLVDGRFALPNLAMGDCRYRRFRPADSFDEASHGLPPDLHCHS